MHVDVGLIVTSKFLEDNTENEEFEKSKLMLKCPLRHIIIILIMIMILLIIIKITVIIITIIIKMIIITIIIIMLLTSVVGKFVPFHRTAA